MLFWLFDFGKPNVAVAIALDLSNSNNYSSRDNHTLRDCPRGYVYQVFSGNFTKFARSLHKNNRLAEEVYKPGCITSDLEELHPQIKYKSRKDRKNMVVVQVVSQNTGKPIQGKGVSVWISGVGTTSRRSSNSNGEAEFSSSDPSINGEIFVEGNSAYKGRIQAFNRVFIN